MLEQVAFPFLQIVLDQDKVVESILEFATVIFCLVLFALTLYAWFRNGRQLSLLIVSIAFLVFLSREALELLPIADLEKTLARAILDFLTLGLFFLALVVRPQRGVRQRDLR